jgi:hypothetical protein
MYSDGAMCVADEEEKHPAGYHIYPFTVALPASVPSSFEGRRGYIRYQCFAFLDRGWKGVLDADMDFTVIRHLDLNTIQNVSVSTQFTLQSLCVFPLKAVGFIRHGTRFQNKMKFSGKI